MIPGLRSYVDKKLAVARDVSGATIGINAELLCNLSGAEIAARLGANAANVPPSTAPSSTSSTKEGSSGSAGAPAGASVNSSAVKFIVVFDGPGRTTKSRLDDGLLRRRVMKALVAAHIPVIVAPALAASQLAYLYTQNYVSHVAGADEALLWSSAPLVLNLFNAIRDPTHAQVVFKKDLINSLRVPEASFIEAVLGAGNNAVMQTPFPLLSGASAAKAATKTHSEEDSELDPNGTNLSDVCRLAFQFGGPAPPPPPPAQQGGSTPQTSPPISVLRASVAAPQCSPEYVQKLRHALVFVQRQPVLDTNGTVHLYNLANQPIPQDLTDVLGRQLSPEVYWYLNKGIIGPELLRGMLFGEFSDCYTLNSGADQSERESLSKVERATQPLRQQAYSLLCSTAHRYFQVKSVRYEYGDFVRTTPQFPEVPPSDAKPAQIVAAAVKYAKGVAKLGDEYSVADLPEQLARRALGSTSTPAPLLVNVAQLALRQLVESALEWYMASSKLPREKTAELVLNLPWA